MNIEIEHISILALWKKYLDKTSLHDYVCNTDCGIKTKLHKQINLYMQRYAT